MFQYCLRRIYFIFFCILFSTAALAEEKCLTTILNELLSDRSENNLTISEQEEIDDLFADASYTPKERAEEAFNILMDARLRQLSDSSAKKIRKIWKSHSHVVFKKNKINGYYSSLRKKTTVILPEEFKETIIEYNLKVHELEHAIQDEVGLEKLGAKIYNQQHFAKMTDVRFLEEAGAMSAEYQYLRLIPKTEKDRIINLIEVDPNIDKSSKNYIIRSLKNSDSLTLREYLDAERKAGRYSRSQIKWGLTVPAKTGIYFSLGMTYIMSSTIVFLTVCEVILRENKYQPPQDLFFQKGCMSLAPIQNKIEMHQNGLSK